MRFVADDKVDDGRFANNGWLQECPDPITKLAWDNAILISPRLAKDLGIQSQGVAAAGRPRRDRRTSTKGKEGAPIAVLTVGGRTIRGPLHIQPGLANYTLDRAARLRPHGRRPHRHGHGLQRLPAADRRRGACGARGDPAI